jgi:hypothetical protein
MAKAPTKRPRQKKLPEASGETKDAAGAEDAFAKTVLEKVKREGGRAVLDAVNYCISSGLTVPPFLAQEWLDRIYPWYFDQIASLDEAFEVQRPKGQHFEDLKRRSALRQPIVLRVIHVKRTQNLPLGGELFAIVGRQFGVTERYVREIWYSKESEFWRKCFALYEKTIFG